MYERKKPWASSFPLESQNLGWRPLADVFRTCDGWLLKYDLAGVGLNDVTVSVRGRQVRVVGQRRDSIMTQAVTQGWRHYSMEISYSRFERTIEMPSNLENARITLEARDGFLLVRMVIEEGNENV